MHIIIEVGWATPLIDCERQEEEFYMSPRSVSCGLCRAAVANVYMNAMSLIAMKILGHEHRL